MKKKNSNLIGSMLLNVINTTKIKHEELRLILCVHVCMLDTGITLNPKSKNLLFTILVIQLHQNIIGPQRVQHREMSKIHRRMESESSKFKNAIILWHLK